MGTGRAPHRLLSDDDPPVFSIERADGGSAVLITCDHAGRADVDPGN